MELVLFAMLNYFATLCRAGLFRVSQGESDAFFPPFGCLNYRNILMLARPLVPRLCFRRSKRRKHDSDDIGLAIGREISNFCLKNKKLILGDTGF